MVFQILRRMSQRLLSDLYFRVLSVQLYPPIRAISVGPNLVLKGEYMKLSAIFLCLFTWSAVVAAGPENSICTQLGQITKGSSVQRLNRYFETQWKYMMNEYPEWATYAGYPGQNDRWTDYSAKARARRKLELKCQLEALQKIPHQGLRGEDQINFNLAKRNLEIGLESEKFDGEYLALNHLNGIQHELPDLLASMPAASKLDYENMIARLDKVPELAGQTEDLLREGLKRKATAVKMFLQRVPAQFDKILTAKVEDSPLYKPFLEMGMTLSAAEKAELQSRARQVIQSKTYPSLKKLKEFLVKEYIPGARESISMSEMPNGKAWYAFEVKEQTTTDLTPEQLHNLGQSEVARITKEMEGVRDQVKFKGDLKAFNQFLLKDKQFYYDKPDKLLIGYRDIAKRIDPELPKLFKTLPRLTYGVREMPSYKAAEAPAAYYEGGSLEAGRAGYFDANTSDLPGRPRWGMEALTLHEAVPGHHLQISIAQELKGIPEFRKQGGYTAFIEGWGLYAESLGDELGLYKDPYSKYGQLSYEMWRAIRLVVDTGMHAKGWTRQQAIDYFADHMAKAPTETAIEVDRYITWPGQALAYKVGQIKFRELRARAQAELGEKFELREFHDQLLKHGALPMDVLEKAVTEWIDTQKKSKPAKNLKERV